MTNVDGREVTGVNIYEKGGVMHMDYVYRPATSLLDKLDLAKLAAVRIAEAARAAAARARAWELAREMERERTRVREPHVRER